MNLEKNILLSDARQEGQKQLQTLVSQLDAIYDSFARNTGGRSKASLHGNLLFTGVWLFAFLTAFHCLRGNAAPFFDAMALGCSVCLGLSMALDGLLQIRYYGSIFQGMDRVRRLRNAVEDAATEAALSTGLETYRGRKDRGFRLALPDTASVPEEATRLQNQLANMQRLSSGFLSKAEKYLFFAACTLWTILGSFAMEDFLWSKLSSDLSWNTFHVLFWIFLLVACIAEGILAAFVWGETNCKVTNITLFACLAGPILFGGLVLVISVVVGIAIALVQLALYVIGAIFALSIVFGATSGS